MNEDQADMLIEILAAMLKLMETGSMQRWK